MATMVKSKSVKRPPPAAPVPGAPSAPTPSVDLDPSLSILKRKGEVEKEGKDYTGIFFSVRFFVDKPVELVNVGFVGVTEKSESSNFMMGIEILYEVYGVKAKVKANLPVLYPLEWHPVTGEKGKAFVVNLKRSVLIPVNRPVKLKFLLKELGDVEHSKVKLNFLKEIAPDKITEKETKVAFCFGNSSAAVDELHFRVAQICRPRSVDVHEQNPKSAE